MTTLTQRVIGEKNQTVNRITLRLLLRAKGAEGRLPESAPSSSGFWIKKIKSASGIIVRLRSLKRAREREDQEGKPITA